MSDIDYNYIHNRKCQLLEELKQVDNDEEMFEEFIRTALRDVAFHTRDQMKKTHSRNRFVRPKGHENCNASSGIHDCLTFGNGKLDNNGFWENPCGECARAHEEQFPEDGPCWPHTKEQLREMEGNHEV